MTQKKNYTPKIFSVNSAGECTVPPVRPGTATLTVGRESVTPDVMLPQDEFDKRTVRWEELARRAFPKTKEVK
jgi:hypothetical protein